MTETSPKAILFDFDGVIVDSESIHHRAYDLALEPLGFPPIPFDVYAEHWSNRHWREYAATAFPGVDLDALKQRKEELFLELMGEAAPLLRGVAPALDRLGARWPLALATGSRRAPVEMVLRRSGLRDRFRAVVAREDYERDKPAPDAYLAACAALGVSPPEAVAIEDSHKGLCAAHAAGVRCVVVPNAYTRRGDFARAASVFDSLDGITVESLEDLCRR